MDAKYWQSIESGLPVAWSNAPDPSNPAPIVQYYFSSVTYQMPLPSSYFTVPVACETAVECSETPPAISSTLANSVNRFDSPADPDTVSMSHGVFSAICISLVVLGASSTYLLQYICSSSRLVFEDFNEIKMNTGSSEDNSVVYNLLAKPA